MVKCPSCGAVNVDWATECRIDGEPLKPTREKPSEAELNTPKKVDNTPIALEIWFAIAVLFGAIGGLLGFAVNYKKDAAKASAMLIVGIISTIIAYVVINLLLH